MINNTKHIDFCCWEIMDFVLAHWYFDCFNRSHRESVLQWVSELLGQQVRVLVRPSDCDRCHHIHYRFLRLLRCHKGELLYDYNGLYKQIYYKSQQLMLVQFSSLLVVVFILEILVGIGGVLLKGRTTEIVENALFDTMKEYGEPNFNETTALWDQVQQRVRYWLLG